jgi:hypothetical protein
VMASAAEDKGPVSLSDVHLEDAAAQEDTDRGEEDGMEPKVDGEAEGQVALE